MRAGSSVTATLRDSPISNAARRSSARPPKFRRVLRRAGVPAADAVAFGDEVRDIEAARAAGITCAAVTWGYAAPEALRAHAPDFVFDRMEEVVRELTRAR